MLFITLDGFSVSSLLIIYVIFNNLDSNVSQGVLAAARLLADDRFDRSKITTVISLAGPLLDPSRFLKFIFNFMAK